MLCEKCSIELSFSDPQLMQLRNGPDKTNAHVIDNGDAPGVDQLQSLNQANRSDLWWREWGWNR